METIEALERKLYTARRAAPNAKYPTGLVIDLSRPEGNIFYLMGVCNRLARELGLSAQLKREYETKINSAGDLSIPPGRHAKMVWDCICGRTIM